jgi:hypothetical protein
MQYELAANKISQEWISQIKGDLDDENFEGAVDTYKEKLPMAKGHDAGGLAFNLFCKASLELFVGNAKRLESALRYDDAITLYEGIGRSEDAGRCRKLKHGPKTPRPKTGIGSTAKSSNMKRKRHQ